MIITTVSTQLKAAYTTEQTYLPRHHCFHSHRYHHCQYNNDLKENNAEWRNTDEEESSDND